MQTHSHPLSAAPNTVSGNELGISGTPVEHAAGHRGGEHVQSRVPVKFQKRSSLWVAIFAVVAAVVLTLIYLRGHLARRSEQRALASEVGRSSGAPVPVDVVHVKPGSHDSELTLPGEARGFYETTIFARTSGYLSEWLVDIGDHVKEGETLATIETPELDDQLVAAKAKVNQLKADAHVAETAVQFAKISAERWEAATSGGAVSKQERDQKQSELESTKAKLESAQAQVDLGQADVQRLLTLQKFKNVTAPFAGTITRRHVDIGDLVTAGSTSSTSPLFTLVQSEQIRVFINVPQVVASTVKIGMPVTLRIRGTTDQTFEGKVARTSGAVDTQSRTLRVEALVPNPDGALRPGTYLQATLHTAREHPPLEVPAAALDFKPGGPQVAVVSKDGHVTFRDVKIQNDMGDALEITGVQEGDAIALNVGNGISEGQQVEPHDLDTPVVAERKTLASEHIAAHLK